MNMNVNQEIVLVAEGAAAEECADTLRERLMTGAVIPYLGPGLLTFDGATAAVPAAPEAVAAALCTRQPVPSRIRTNMWSVAQYIEQRRHRKTLAAWMSEIFAATTTPTALHGYLASLRLPLIIDSWYDGTMREALIAAGADGVVNLQGVTRALEHRDIWTKAYDLAGDALEPDSFATTVLYEPHGSRAPAGNFLVADSDYVEVLTEIDIQTPIPDAIRRLRTERGFLFLGCRFDDQMLRTYARQIMKRSAGPHYAVMNPDTLTRNERRFLAQNGIAVIALPAEAITRRWLAAA
ncbi:SIR2 family protein [Martelella sp. HB161492]|uniref:SIR2 family NAD-dependent protein deacylase n=1 Tax=Martelella sp. HB161492 TaxID=2720726 RepID=UPI0015922214|nr:SIR2 family protein [Martelella sp. HB161492]